MSNFSLLVSVVAPGCFLWFIELVVTGTALLCEQSIAGTVFPFCAGFFGLLTLVCYSSSINVSTYHVSAYRYASVLC